MIEELVDQASVVGALTRLGLEPTGEVTSLPGGVSNRVFLATTTSSRVVIKQSVERLMVKEEWLAPRERVLAEAAAMSLYHSIAPDHSPALVALDPDNFTLVMTAAPSPWSDWKQRLLSGVVEPSLGTKLGAILGESVLATSDVTLPPLLDDVQRFQDLRIAPYFETTAERQPSVSASILDVAAEIKRRRTALVHGDFSPKNFLTDGGDIWITDFEVAHRGDPAFDVAFLTSHLVLKSIAAPRRSRQFLDCLNAFLDSYYETTGLDSRDDHMPRITGALMLARVHGRSPVDYLSTEQSLTASHTGTVWLNEPRAFWKSIERNPQ